MFRKRKKPMGDVEGADAEMSGEGSSVKDEAEETLAEGEGVNGEFPDSLEELSVPASPDGAGDGASNTGGANSASSEPDELERLRAENRESYDKYLRTLAELENVKKRAVKERSDILKYAGESLARDIVDVLDDIERALAADSVGTLEDFLKGVSLIRDRFRTILEQHSIKAKSGLGQHFDPLVQQALASVPTADHEPGRVIQEYKKAYYFKDKLLRPGQVVVAAAPAGSEGDESKDS